MPKARPKSTRAVPRKMHIYCEGEKTEPNYLNCYLADLKDDSLREVVLVEPSRKNTPAQLVEVAIEHKKNKASPEGDVFWVVYDRESPAKYPDHIHDKAYKRALDNGIHVAISNVCFEQWLLLHFISSDAPYNSYDDLLANSCLKTEFRRVAGISYDKGCPKIYDYIAHNIATARKRAKAINERTLGGAAAGKLKPHNLNPYTDMPKLLDAIDVFGKPQ